MILELDDLTERQKRMSDANAAMHGGESAERLAYAISERRDEITGILWPRETAKAFERRRAAAERGLSQALSGQG